MRKLFESLDEIYNSNRVQKAKKSSDVQVQGSIVL